MRRCALSLMLCVFLAGCPISDEDSRYRTTPTPTPGPIYTLTPTPAPTPTPKTALSVLSYSIRDSYYGDARIYGEVKNSGTVGAEFVEVNATLYSSTGNVIGAEYTFCDPSTIPPGRTYSFTIFTDLSAGQIASVRLIPSYSFATSEDPEAGLRVQGVTQALDYFGDVEVLGEIHNSSNQTKEYCEAIATFYNAAGRVVYADYTFASPANIPAGATHAFKILTDVKPAEFSTYRVIAVSN